ncbi:sulfatase-like hydrolase/transferase [Qipengyuania aurantiaca]|uniref:Sulfatase-like hydrolase/transferase n=1 Tax=Qipengyuania aurantiaca TaxID=2867233 RepID=A0ABX8ZJT8_9SPHN|nr:sulfatase-like hydrolase/transferase [Qipengyuania aurantiaca]QZD89262.1 sulfatase-like hydrolase/transferase [Qipengyuania aurantiaca]
MKFKFVLALAGCLAACGGEGGSQPAPVATSSPTPTPTLTPSPVSEQPNVIVILADDLNDYVEPLQGHPQAYTPNFSRLARLGVTFSNAHANSPVCSPSRASFMSGYLPSTSGKYHSTYHFRDHAVLSDAKLLPEHFRDNGYAVYNAGKLFHEQQYDNTVFGNFEEETQATGRNDRSGGYFGPMSEFGPYPWDGVSIAEGKPTRFIPYGVEGADWSRLRWGKAELLPGGRWNSNPDLPAAIQSWSWGYGRISQPPTFTSDMNSSYPAGHSYSGFAGPSGEFRYVSDSDRSLLTDERIARWASEVLRKQTPSEHKFAETAPLTSQQFMMMLGLTKTHSARYIPDAYFDEFIAARGLQSIDDVQFPELFEGSLHNSDLADVPNSALYGHGRKNFDQLIEAGSSGGFIPDLVNPGSFIPNTQENLLRSQILSYLVSVYVVDQQLGQILDAIEADPTMRRNSIVIVTSDHGWATGQKMMWGKMSLFSESTRIPLIIADLRGRFDNSRGTVSDIPVSLIDIYPTLIELADIQEVLVPDGRPQLDGQSLVPAMMNPGRPAMSRTPYAITSNFGGYSDSISTAVPSFRNHTIRGGRWRFTLSRGSAEELYDHKADPNEFHNIHDRAYWIDLKRKLDTELRSQIGM